MIDRDMRFNELATAQRGKPERATEQLHELQTAQLYCYVCEHIGDLTHRMAQDFSFFHGGFQWVDEKVRKTLRSLEHKYGFEKDWREQITSNLKFHGKPEADFDIVLIGLKEAGQAYANAHRELVVWNHSQWLAQRAAIAMGEMDFGKATLCLKVLRRDLNRDAEHWTKTSGRFTGKAYKPGGM